MGERNRHFTREFKLDAVQLVTERGRPVGIYGLTKVYQTHLMNFYYNTHKIDVVMAITFNLMGKRHIK